MVRKKIIRIIIYFTGFISFLFLILSIVWFSLGGTALGLIFISVFFVTAILLIAIIIEYKKNLNELKIKSIKLKTDLILSEKRSNSLKKIIKSYTKIPLGSMAQLLEFANTIELQKWIMDLPDDLALTINGTEVLIPATLKNDQSITKMTDNIASYFHTCYYCAEPLEEGAKTCPNCNKEVMKCVVCKLNINFGDAVGKCSLCEAVGHLTHLQEWLKVNGKCPHCQQQLPPEGIVVLEPRGAKKKK